jgi:glycosyltransferase involved in cell wall biosynthesis
MSILNRKHTISEVISFFIHFIFGILSVAKSIKKHNVVLVHSNTCHVLAGAIAAKIMKVTHIWHIHERDISPSFLRKMLARTVLFLSEKVITVSEENRRHFFGARHCSAKIAVISGGVDLSRFNKGVSGQRIKDEFNLDGNTKLIGMVGRITPWKGQIYFLEAASKVIKPYPNTKFLVVGDTDLQSREQYKRDLIVFAKNLDLSQHIIFTGFRTDIPELLAALDILVLPSAEPEPFGLVLIEAMALSKPVIATSIGGPLEIIDDRKTGILVPPRDSNALAEVICELLSNELKRAEMGRNGRKRVESRFTWSKTVQSIEAIYQEVLA